MARKRATGSPAGTEKAKASTKAPKPSGLAGPLDMSSLAMSLRTAATRDLAKIGAVPQDSLIDRVYGVPLVGNLPMQFLLGVDILPMERTLSLVGEKGSLKSVMSWYFATLFLRYRYPGMVFFEDSEFKTNDDQIRGVIQNDNLLDFVFPTEVHNVQEMIETMVFYSKQYDILVPEHNVPICYLIDSIGALTSQAAQDAMEKTGNVGDVAGYDRARTAALITEHFRSWVPLQAGKPMVLIYVNHIKEKIAAEGGKKGASYGPPEKVSPGGVHKDYLNTATIEMIKTSTPRIKSEMRATVIMKTLKASLTETGRKIEVMMRTLGPMNMRYPEGDKLGILESENDVQRYYVYFDWDTALVDLLTSDRFLEKDLADVLGGSGITGKGAAVGCKRLQLSQVPRQELGRAIHADAQIVKELQDVIGVLRKRHYIPPGVTESKAVPGSGAEARENEEGS
jgi:hypothetical protein